MQFVHTAILHSKLYVVGKQAKMNQKKCRDPGSNRGPLDLQSNALPTELSRHMMQKIKFIFEEEL